MPSTIFITSASTGIGRATAELFFERSWNVVASMRTPEKSKAAGRKDPRWLASPAGCDRRRLGLRSAAGGTGT